MFSWSEAAGLLFYEHEWVIDSRNEPMKPTSIKPKKSKRADAQQTTAPSLTPLPSPAPSLKADLQQITQVAGYLSAVLTVLSLGIPAVLAWVTEYLGPAIPIWKAFVATAPLTLAVAIIGLGMLRGWLDDIVSFCVWTAGAFLVTGAVGHWLGLCEWIDPLALWQKEGGNPIQFSFVICWTFLENYWRMYGTQMFCSSLLVGSFLAWAWGVKLLPHLSNLPASMDELSSRRAA
jgi:uncharacterized protein (DUF983 family)